MYDQEEEHSLYSLVKASLTIELKIILKYVQEKGGELQGIFPREIKYRQ